MGPLRRQVGGDRATKSGAFFQVVRGCMSLMALGVVRGGPMPPMLLLGDMLEASSCALLVLVSVFDLFCRVNCDQHV